MTGNLTQSGTINTTGDRAYGIHLTGPLTGNARIQGATSAFGVNAVGAALDADVSGGVVLQGSVTASGYRYTSRPPLSTDRAKLDADDLLIGGLGAATLNGGNGAAYVEVMIPNVESQPLPDEALRANPTRGPASQPCAWQCFPAQPAFTS